MKRNVSYTTRFLSALRYWKGTATQDFHTATWLFTSLCRKKKKGSNIAGFHRATRRLILNQKPWLLRRLHLLLVILIWPLSAIYSLFTSTVRFGSGVLHKTGKNYRRQISEQCRLLLNHAISPRAYYVHRFFEDRNRIRAVQYVHRFETKNVLFNAINQKRNCDWDPAKINNKCSFAKACNLLSLPTIPVLLRLENGVIFSCRGPKNALPAVNLIVKPTKGKGGRDIERFDYCGIKKYRAMDGQVFWEKQLREYFRRISLCCSYLVQERLVNHRALIDLTADVLSTLRILTAITQSNQVVVLRATFKIQKGNLFVDNYSRGGFGAAVDLKTGTLGRALEKSPFGDWLDCHPNSGAPITGRKLPHWKQILSLVKEAHRCFSEFAFIAWDVGSVDGGPVLVEANSNPGLDLLQMPHQDPLGSSRFVELANHYLGESPGT